MSSIPGTTGWHAANARAALDTFVERDGGTLDAEALRDLITGLGHWAIQNGIAFEAEVVHALATWWCEHAETPPDAQPTPPTEGGTS